MTGTQRTAETSREVWRDRWLASKTSAGTRDTYARGITPWFAHCDRARLDVWDAEAHDVDDYRNGLRGAHATIARRIATVSSFYRFVLRRGRPAPILTNPAADVERPRVDTASRRAGLDAPQAITLRSVALTADARTAALVHLLLGTGMRVSEAVNSRLDGLAWTTGGDRTLEVVRKGGAPDVVVIEPNDWAVIARYLDQRRDDEPWLLTSRQGGAMSRQTAYRLVRSVSEQVVPRGVLIGPHSLRHTVATLALDAGESVQEVQGMLRHASAATTQRYDRRFRERGRGASRTLARMYEGVSSNG